MRKDQLYSKSYKDQGEKEEQEFNLEDEGIYILMGEICTETVSEVISFILKANLQPKKLSNLTLFICSHGGDLCAAFALIDIMKGSNIPVHTVGIGDISSSGLLIFMSGQKNHRILTPNTSILSHQFSSYYEGKDHELVSRVKEFKLTTERMVNLYKSCTGLKEADIKKYLLPEADVYLSAKDALRLGICDKVINLNGLTPRKK